MRIKEDEHLIPALLRGDIPQGSKLGMRAQKALAELFVCPEGLTSEIRRELWSLFYPSKPRRVVIKKQPRMSKLERDGKIAGHIYDYLQTHGPGAWEAAIEDAKKEFAKKGIHLALQTIKGIWTRYRRGDIPPF
jgi:hypothetical protein